MWKKGELVWVRSNPSDTWIPGRILDPSEPSEILVSFFDLMEQRYVPKLCLRSFERDFETLVADSWRFRHFVDRALQTHFWNISFGLWCSCQPPIDSPYLDRGYSLSCSPHLSSDSALGFVREMAVSRRVPLRRLAVTNCLTAQILSFRRYTVDFKRSESVYKQVIENAKLVDRVEEQVWCLDPSNKMDCMVPPMFPETADSSRYLSPLPKDIHCSSVDKLVQSWSTRNPLISSDSSVMKTCATLARTSNHGDAAHSLKSRERFQVVESICLQNSESLVEDIIEDDSTDAIRREAPPYEVSPHIIGSSNKEFVSKKVATTVKRKGSRDKASGNSKRRIKASQQSIPADPKCLRMRFLSTHGSLPSKSELFKRFSVFGKIDTSRTDVNVEKSSAKVVFLQSIDAVTAYQSVKKIKLGRSKVVYRLDALE